MEILLGTVGAAPPTLVDGAAAGLGAVLREMHREGVFAAASSAEVSLPVHRPKPQQAKGELVSTDGTTVAYYVVYFSLRKLASTNNQGRTGRALHRAKTRQGFFGESHEGSSTERLVCTSPRNGLEANLGVSLTIAGRGK